MAKLNAPVYFLGAGCSKFGNMLETPEIKGLTLQELSSIAVNEALKDADTEAGEIDAVFIGTHTLQGSNLNAAYNQISRWIGMEMKAGVQIGAGCATTAVGATLAAMGIASGAYRKVLVVAFESTQSYPLPGHPYLREQVTIDKMWEWTDYGVNQAYMVPQGYDIFPFNGMAALGYCQKYGYGIEEYDRAMMLMCRERRYNGSLNEKAYIREPLEDEAARLGFNDLWEFWTSPFNPHAPWPGRIRSGVTPCDGASAMVLSNAEGARAYKGTPIELIGFGTAVKDAPWFDDDSTVASRSSVEASRLAFEMAGISPNEIGYGHFHDCAHIHSLCFAEIAGYLPQGEGLKYVRDGRTAITGDKPMSTHGGRHAFGHAWSASAGTDVWEAMRQMRGTAGKAQIPTAPEFSILFLLGYCNINTVLIMKKGM